MARKSLDSVEIIVSVGGGIALLLGILTFTMPVLLTNREQTGFDALADALGIFMLFGSALVLVVAGLALFTLWMHNHLRLPFKLLGCAPALLTIAIALILFVLVMFPV